MPAYVRLIEPAVDDLRRLLARDPQILRAVLRKLLLLERAPEAGEPLLGALIGWRKLVVGDRHWRIVWRVTSDANGRAVLTICEVWAVGARSDADVYREMLSRIDAAEKNPSTIALAEVARMLAGGLGRHPAVPAAEPIDDPVPPWLRQRLVHTAGLSVDEVDAMSGAAAMDRWEQFLGSGGTAPN
jgi:mRNA interferase RelE/StbE